MNWITTFKGRAKPLDAWDFGRLGRLLSVGEDELRAVVEVECSGSGFDRHGRPKMLFEPHRFWRELGDAKRGVAFAQGLAYPKWGSKPYPSDSYPRLEAALGISAPGLGLLIVEAEEFAIDGGRVSQAGANDV